MFDGELCSSIRISVLTSEWRMSRQPNCSAMFFTPTSIEARSSSIRLASSPIPTKRRAVSGTSLCDGAAGLSWPASISTPISGSRIVRPEHQAFYRRVFLHETIARAAFVSGLLIKPVALMAVRFPDSAGKGLRALSRSCARALSSGGCCSSAAASAVPGAGCDRYRVRARLDRPAVLTDGRALRRPRSSGGTRCRCCGPDAPLASLMRESAANRIGDPARSSPACLHPRATFTTH